MCCCPAASLLTGSHSEAKPSRQVPLTSAIFTSDGTLWRMSGNSCVGAGSLDRAGAAIAAQAAAATTNEAR